MIVVKSRWITIRSPFVVLDSCPVSLAVVIRGWYAIRRTQDGGFIDTGMGESVSPSRLVASKTSYEKIDPGLADLVKCYPWEGIRPEGEGAKIGSVWLW